MGFYTELFCDNDDCRSSSRYEGPQGSTRREVAKSALRGGWQKTDGKWLCPDCVSRLDHLTKGEGRGAGGE